MKKNSIWMKGILAILIIIVSALAIIKNKNILNNDAKQLKEEYESLNDTIRESDGAKYNNVEIPEKNSIKYINALEAVEIIKNKSGIIYFGANWCPWCRNAIEVLLEVAKNKDNETIYYVNMDNVRNIWEIKEGKLEKTTKEKEGYYELLEALNDVLNKNTYKLTDKDGKEYDTLEKRIGMPLVIALKNGKIIEKHSGTVKLNETQTKYSKLEDEQKEELKNIYAKMIEKTK